MLVADSSSLYEPLSVRDAHTQSCASRRSGSATYVLLRLTCLGAAASASRADPVRSTATGGMSPEALHHQIMRNAYVVAQSQLLQLAKQMEFDVDLSPWEEEAHDKMQEFWDQMRQNVEAFCARVQYVLGYALTHRHSDDTMSTLAADVVKSPRKHGAKSVSTATNTVPRSPSPTCVMLEARTSPSKTEASSPTPIEPHVDASCSDDDMLAMTSLPSQAVPHTEESDMLVAPADDVLAEAPAPSPRPTAKASEADEATVSNEPMLASEASMSLPALTPGTGLRTKRTLGSAVLRSTKKPDVKDAPAPKAPTRFRSSFLNKSLHHALEERQGKVPSSSDVDADENMPSGLADDAPQVESETTAQRAARPSQGPSLDALRTRLEHVRRTSTTPASTHTLSHATSRSALSPKGKREVQKKPTTVTTPPRSPSRLERPATSQALSPTTARAPSRLDRSPSRLERPMSRVGGMNHHVRPASPWQSPQRDASAAKAATPFARRAVESPKKEPVPPSPSRLRDDARSPFRASKTATTSTTPASARSRLPVSPSRLGMSTSASKIPSPVRKPVPPITMDHGAERERATTPSLHTARPASVADTRAPPHGLGARIKGLFGLQTGTPAAAPAHQADTSITTPPRVRPATAMATSPSSLPIRAKVVPAPMPKEDTSETLMTSALQAAATSWDDDLLTPMPGSFDEALPSAPASAAVPSLSASTSTLPSALTTSQRGTSSMAPTPIKLKPMTLSKSTSTRPGTAAPRAPGSVRTSVRVPSAPVSTSARTSIAAKPTYTYDMDGKRRKLSQHPLTESTNYEGHTRASTEDALKSKLTTQSGVRVISATTKAVRASSAAERPPSSAATSHRVWSGSTATASSRAPPTTTTSTTKRSSAISTQNVFQQAPIPASAARTDEAVPADDTLPDVASEYSDSDDEASVRKRKLEPSWTRGRDLEELLLQQASIDPDEIFGCQTGPVPLDTMLPPRQGDRRRMRHRTSSANWNGPDGLAQWEIDRYNERMGIHTSRTTNS